MSFFEDMQSRTLPKPEEAEVKLDLRGIEKGAALEKLDAMVTYCRKSMAATLYIRYDAPVPGESESLFQPLARYIALEKDRGVILNALPLMDEKHSGLYVTFKR